MNADALQFTMIGILPAVAGLFAVYRLNWWRGDSWFSTVGFTGATCLLAYALPLLNLRSFWLWQISGIILSAGHCAIATYIRIFQGTITNPSSAYRSNAAVRAAMGGGRLLVFALILMLPGIRTSLEVDIALAVVFRLMVCVTALLFTWRGEPPALIRHRKQGGIPHLANKPTEIIGPAAYFLWAGFGVVEARFLFEGGLAGEGQYAFARAGIYLGMATCAIMLCLPGQAERFASVRRQSLLLMASCIPLCASLAHRWLGLGLVIACYVAYAGITAVVMAMSDSGIQLSTTAQARDELVASQSFYRQVAMLSGGILTGLLAHFVSATITMAALSLFAAALAFYLLKLTKQNAPSEASSSQALCACSKA
jgi:hypothetical protein